MKVIECQPQLLPGRFPSSGTLLWRFADSEGPFRAPVLELANKSGRAAGEPFFALTRKSLLRKLRRRAERELAHGGEQIVWLDPVEAGGERS